MTTANLYSYVVQSPATSAQGQLYTYVMQMPADSAQGQLYSNVPAPVKPGKNALREVILRDKPRGYWEFEEAAAATQFADSIHGSILQERGDVTAAVAGYATNSLAVAGFSNLNYLDWPLQPSISGVHTVECLFKLTAFTNAGGHGLFGSRGATDFSTSAWMRTSDGALVVSVGTGAGMLTDHAIPNNTLVTAGWALDKWHHLGVVAKTTGLEVYFNGRSVATVSYTGTPLLTDANHLLRVGQIGSIYVADYNGANATIDEFAVYDKALAPERFQVRNDADLASAENAQFSGFTGWGVPL